MYLLQPSTVSRRHKETSKVVKMSSIGPCPSRQQRPRQPRGEFPDFFRVHAARSAGVSEGAPDEEANLPDTIRSMEKA